jgi:hypothetical protein
VKALKTMIATAVIVLALTTVALAGVQHFTKTPNAEAAGKAPVNYTVTLSAKQLAQLIGAQSAGQGNATRPAHSAAKQTQRHAHAQHVHHARSNSRQSTSSHHSGSHHHQPAHHAGTAGSGNCGDGGGNCSDGGGNCGD